MSGKDVAAREIPVGIPISEEKLIALHAVDCSEFRESPEWFLFEFTGEKPWPASPPYYTIAGYRTDRGFVDGRPDSPPRDLLGPTDDAEKVVVMWRDISGHELGEASMKGWL